MPCGGPTGHLFDLFSSFELVSIRLFFVGSSFNTLDKTLSLVGMFTEELRNKETTTARSSTLLAGAFNDGYPIDFFVKLNSYTSFLSVVVARRQV